MSSGDTDAAVWVDGWMGGWVGVGECGGWVSEWVGVVWGCGGGGWGRGGVGVGGEMPML
jgi:hypothetical protein